MSEKVLIIGSKGMAGHLLKQYLEERTAFEVHDISRSADLFKSTYQLDVTDFSVLSQILKEGDYKAVINCVGVLNQFAENNPGNAILINSYLPHFLSELSDSLGYRFIHISTDCVFSGSKGGYSETDAKDGIGIYANTKALGEVINDNSLTIRTSIIGPELKSGIGLFHWFMSQEGTVNGYSNAMWSGVTTVELAKSICTLIDSELSGLVHLTNGTPISKLDLIEILNNQFRNNSVEIVPFESKKVDKSIINTRSDFRYQCPSYEGMVSEMYDWIKAHSLEYSYIL